MSNSLAVASVTATLRYFLQSALTADPVLAVNSPKVTSVSPAGPGLPDRGANLFLFQVSPNAAFRGSDAPTRTRNGLIAQRPTLALDLHYLLSFHGDPSTFEPQRVMATALLTLHTAPMLSRTMISDSLTAIADDDAAYAFLRASNLADQAETVRVSLEEASLEAMTKIWSVFFQTPYVVSVLFRAGPVFIDADLAPHVARPVRTRNLYVHAPGVPALKRVQGLEAGPIISGDEIVLEGWGLMSDQVVVRLAGDVDVVPDLSQLRPDRIVVTVPPTVPAGVVTVQVAHLMRLGTPPTDRPALTSNTEAFILRPTVADAATANVAVSGLTHAADLEVLLSPAVTARQTVEVILSEVAPGARGFSFSVPSRPPESLPTDTLTVPISGLPEGTFGVRVRVDGAENAIPAGMGSRRITLP